MHRLTEGSPFPRSDAERLLDGTRARSDGSDGQLCLRSERPTASRSDTLTCGERTTGVAPVVR
jgi:hypothetical protein